MKLKLMGVTLLLANLAGAAAAAEITDRKTLTLDGARRAIGTAVAQDHENHAGDVITVVDDGGNLMALERVDGTFAAGAKISGGPYRGSFSEAHASLRGDHRQRPHCDGCAQRLYAAAGWCADHHRRPGGRRRRRDRSGQRPTR